MQTLQRTGPLPLHEFRDEYLPSLGFQTVGSTRRGGGRLLAREECSIKLVTNTETAEVELCIYPSYSYKRDDQRVRQRVRSDRITVVSPTWEDFFALMSLLGLSHLLDSPEPASTIPPV